MSGRSSYDREQLPPAASTARALKRLLAAARRHLASAGSVRSETWDAIDTLNDAMIEQMPEPKRRRV